ncbi:DUF4202 domain-containing protein [Halomonas daqingensis]|uniref:DUF4202 domain-containing protein n=1 Tax=Billgrantia desiderata TaxID=52021 RepID=A0AAW4YUC1_9GAMM|nr:DUF4202 domain-containing protein [Halomonas desiderata]MCE8031352.1 DUF4202 domain-containing protein [Halomonas desiderata]MCE8044998.1 DUF4202 domain-containing protein [Halomonas desiderata]MCE8049572.1 DUF4202 domain-containing protein [Halomonas desiderata]MCE8051988.1 DUF4202 domain-containing protein [Halomonas desiderata]NIC39139.1 DUF4202 domain-containing protein [Halomonas desiderata]
MTEPTPFQRAMTELDALHAQDPRQVEVEGETLPLELWHAGRMSAWLERVVEAPSELVQLAVRSQHLQRWEVPRSEYPEGRVGYLTWRRDQGKRAGETTARVMEAAGYSAEEAAEVSRMIRKQGLGRDPGTQAVEDCACLVFLENYFADFSKQVEHDHLVRIVQMTWKKMSPKAHELALTLPMSAEARAVVEEALAG